MSCDADIGVQGVPTVAAQVDGVATREKSDESVGGGLQGTSCSKVLRKILLGRVERVRNARTGSVESHCSRSCRHYRVPFRVSTGCFVRKDFVPSCVTGALGVNRHLVVPWFDDSQPLQGYRRVYLISVVCDRWSGFIRFSREEVPKYCGFYLEIGQF